MDSEGQKIKILFLIDRLLPGGTEKQLVELAEALPRDSYTPVIAVFQETEYQSSLDLRTPVLHIRPISTRALLRSASLIHGIVKLINKEKFSIVQTFFIDASIYGALAVKLSRTKAILIGTRRNLYFWVHNQRYSFFLYRLTSRFASTILTNSHRTLFKATAIEHIPSRKLKVIPNGIDTERYSIIPSERAKKELGLNGAYPVIGVLANWRPIKGLTIFLKAASIVHGRYPTSKFILAGFGPQKDELEKLTLDLELRESTIFLENQTDLIRIISAFDIAVQPSLSESFSNVLIEYMVLGKPVVATKVGDADLIIRDRQEGLLVEPDDPERLASTILEILENGYKAKKMGILAREKVLKHYDMKKIIRQYDAFYQGILNQSMPNEN
jgi:glycosyltransferase involved in cell wall biosynthesis